VEGERGWTEGVKEEERRGQQRARGGEGRRGPWRRLGPPWKSGLEPWLKISYPFLHADRIKTPTLFLCGDKDFNVPLLGSEQMYQALRNVGTDSQLIIYPGENHGIAKPSFQRDRMQRYLDWYKKYL